MSFNIKFFAFFIVFFVTLQSFYFYQISLAPFPIIAFLGLIVASKYLLFDNKIVKLCFLFILLFITSAVIGVILKIDFYYINSLLGIIIGPIFLLLAVSLIKKLGNITFSNVIKWVLITHLFFFLIQFIGFYLLKKNIDYLVLFTGEESRLEGFGAITGLARCTGLFNEPATYSYYVFFFSVRKVFIK